MDNEKRRIGSSIVFIIAITLVMGLASCSVDSEANRPQAESEPRASETQASQESQPSPGLAEQSAAESPEVGQSATDSVSAEQDASQQSASAAPAASVVEGVEDPWVEGGRFSTGDSELDALVKEFCDKHSDPNLSPEDNAFNVYCQAVWRDYIEHDTNQEPVGPDWDKEYAKQSLKSNSGNCYEFAAVDEYILKYFGYSDAQAEPCLIQLQSGGYGDHGLTFVTDKDGRKCLCDSAFGANGWLLDADTYTVQLIDVGQDASEHTVAEFEEIVRANWLS